MISVSAYDITVTANNAIKADNWEAIIHQQIGQDAAMLKLTLTQTRILRDELSFILGEAVKFGYGMR